MAATDKEFENQLIEPRKKLRNPPNAVEELLPALDISDIELGAIQPLTERHTSNDAHERISDNGTVQMPPNSTIQIDINNRQNAVNDLFLRDEATTENRIFGRDISPFTSWYYMPLVMFGVIILAGILNLFL